jgi:hypothetical protein
VLHIYIYIYIYIYDISRLRVKYSYICIYSTISHKSPKIFYPGCELLYYCLILTEVRKYAERYIHNMLSLILPFLNRQVCDLAGIKRFQLYRKVFCSDNELRLPHRLSASSCSCSTFPDTAEQHISPGRCQYIYCTGCF